MGRIAVLCNYILHDYVVYMITYLCLFILCLAPDNTLSLRRNNAHYLVASCSFFIFQIKERPLRLKLPQHILTGYRPFLNSLLSLVISNPGMILTGFSQVPGSWSESG